MGTIMSNTNMISRETCSVVPNSLLVGSLVLLGSFLVGVLASYAACFFQTRYLVVPSPATVQELKDLNACDNEDRISIMKWYDKPTRDLDIKPRIGTSFYIEFFEMALKQTRERSLVKPIRMLLPGVSDIK